MERQNERLVPRVALQLLFIALVWWSGWRRPGAAGPEAVRAAAS